MYTTINKFRLHFAILLTFFHNVLQTKPSCISNLLLRNEAENNTQKCTKLTRKLIQQCEDETNLSLSRQRTHENRPCNVDKQQNSFICHNNATLTANYDRVVIVLEIVMHEGCSLAVGALVS